MKLSYASLFQVIKLQFVAIPQKNCRCEIGRFNFKLEFCDHFKIEKDNECSATNLHIE